MKTKFAVRIYLNKGGNENWVQLNTADELNGFILSRKTGQTLKKHLTTTSGIFANKKAEYDILDYTYTHMIKSSKQYLISTQHIFSCREACASSGSGTIMINIQIKTH